MAHEIDDPLGDPLDRDLEALLAVEPSPEFVARVRTRIAQEPAPSTWRWNWTFALAGAVAAVVLAVLVTSWTASVTPTAGPQQEVSREDVGLAAEPSVVRLKPDTTKDLGERGARREVRSVRLQPDARGGRLQAGRADEPPSAEVLVSADERLAFAMLLTSIEQRRMPAMPAAVDAAQSIEPPAIDIPDLVIEPLPLIAALE